MKIGPLLRLDLSGTEYNIPILGPTIYCSLILFLLISGTCLKHSGSGTD